MADLRWVRHVENGDSPYPEDRRRSWTCAEFELAITREGDGNYWLRHRKDPLGLGPRLRDAKEAAQRFVAEGREAEGRTADGQGQGG